MVLIFFLGRLFEKDIPSEFSDDFVRFYTIIEQSHGSALGKADNAPFGSGINGLLNS
jgi:hypothetical protein